MNLLSLNLFWMCCNAINFVLLRFEFCSLWLASNIPLDIPLKYFFSSEHSNRPYLVILSKKEKGHHFSVKKIKSLHFFETTVCIARKLRRKKKDNVIAKKLCFLSTWCIYTHTYTHTYEVGRIRKYQTTNYPVVYQKYMTHSLLLHSLRCEEQMSEWRWIYIYICISISAQGSVKPPVRIIAENMRWDPFRRLVKSRCWFK